MLRIASLAFAIVALAAAAFVSAPTVENASAAPAGAATNLQVSGTGCTNGLASYRMTWTPSGSGPQRVDLSATNNGFASNYSSGSFDANASAVDLTALKPGTTYYVRIVTGTAGGVVASDTLSFAASCTVTSPPFSPPTGLKSSAAGKGTIRFQWTAGQGNQFYCLDTASSAADLVNLKGTWRNHGCHTTRTTLDVSNLGCGAAVYWRVFAWGTSSGHSQAAVAQQPCTIGAPGNLKAQQSGANGVLLSWSRGTDNRWFCVDVARSVSDLNSISGSWRNYGCWMTGTSIQLNNLDCGATYYWAVYTWNEVTHSRSANSSFEVLNCSTKAQAPIEDVDIVKVGSRYYAEITAVLPNGCHTPASHQVQRNGNTFRISVENNVAPGPCTFIYSEYDLSVNLGSDLIDGQTYKVVVNGDVTESFVAD